MSLNREVSLGVGLATAALVWGVYQAALPTLADVRVGAPADRDIATTERVAAWTAASVVAGVSLLAKDATVFVLGGSMVVALSWWHRFGNHYDASIGSAVTPSARTYTEQPGTTVGAGYTPGV